MTRPDGTVGAKVSVRRGIAQLVSLLLDQCQKRGYLLHPEQCGGYVCRPIAGTSIPSNHSWGLAIDVNWLQNPQRRPLTTNIPSWMVQLWERYGFIWGGRWGGATVPDPMHFEASGTPAQMAEFTALAIREFGQQGSLPWPDWMPPGHYFGLITGPGKSHGGYYDWEKPYVRLIQQAMIRFGYVPGVSDPTSPWADGIYEQPTADAVAAWQRDHMPGTTYYGQVWQDDWAEMVRELQA